MSDSKAVEFYFDYASPYAYLANVTLKEQISCINIVYKPIYLRGLETFRSAMPFVPNKLKYIMVDVVRCAKLAGVKITMPNNFPINGIYAVRGAIYTLENGGFEEYNEALFNATWVENKNVSDKQMVIDLAVKTGQNAEAFSSGIDDSDLKDRLKKQTAQAESAGLFGVPSFIVEGELFWGCDRIDQVKNKLAEIAS